MSSKVEQNNDVPQDNEGFVEEVSVSDGDSKLSRRKFITLAVGAGAGLALAGCGAPAATKEPATAAAAAVEVPNVAKTTELRMLQWSNFVSEMDDTIIQQAADWGKANKVEVTIERISTNDIPARLASSVQAQAGPDIIQLWDGWGWLYEESLADVSDVAKELNDSLGGFYADVEAWSKVNDTWRTVPHALIPNAFAYRTDFYESVLGSTAFPDTWEDFIKVGQQLKESGPTHGVQLTHSFGDPPTFWYPWLWAWGGKEVEEDGKTIALDSPETLLAVQKAIELHDTATAPGALSWDDSSNNRAYFANQIATTLNGASIYVVAQRDFPDLVPVTDHGIHPKGPAGRFSYSFNWSSGVMKYSENQSAAKDFLRHIMQPEQYGPWLGAGGGYAVGALHEYDDHPVWDSDPKLLPFRNSVTEGNGRWPGWPGPPNAGSARVRNDYIIIDLFAKACSGEFSPEEAIKWAADQLDRRYNA